MDDYIKKTGFLFGGNAVFIEELYRQYLTNPTSVDQIWQEFFAQVKDSSELLNKSTAKVILKTELTDSGILEKPASTTNKFNVGAMIKNYRKYGHYLANLDPLGLEIRKTKSDLKLGIENFGFTNDQLNNVIEHKFLEKTYTYA